MRALLRHHLLIWGKVPSSTWVHAGTERSQLAITAGTEVGALLVDGLGDGALIECPGEDLEFLRLMTFGMLQVCAAQSTRATTYHERPLSPHMPSSNQLHIPSRFNVSKTSAGQFC